MAERKSGSGGMGFVGWLAILFIALKLTGHIDWSWWWVLAPLWISFGLFVAMLLVAGLAMFFAYLQDRAR